MLVWAMAARPELCASANPYTAAAEAVTRKSRRDRFEVVAVTLSLCKSGVDRSGMSSLLQSNSK
jgi:hypothetical protein